MVGIVRELILEREGDIDGSSWSYVAYWNDTLIEETRYSVRLFEGLGFDIRAIEGSFDRQQGVPRGYRTLAKEDSLGMFMKRIGQIHQTESFRVISRLPEDPR